jgi:glutathione S-transferase
MADYPTLADAVLAGVARLREDHEVADVARWPILVSLRSVLGADPGASLACDVRRRFPQRRDDVLWHRYCTE